MEVGVLGKRWVLVVDSTSCGMIKTALTGILVVIFTMASGQETREERLYHFTFTGTSIVEAMDEVERQSGMTFSYRASLLDHFPRVTRQFTRATLTEVLDGLFLTAGIQYQVLNNYIILSRKKQGYILSGIVRDAETRETLIGATVYDMKRRRGAVTNEHGFYSLTLEPGEVHLSVSFVGYAPFECSFSPVRDTVISVALVPDTRLEEVSVTGEAVATWVKNIQPGQVQFPVKVVNSLPALLSEGDVLKTLQLLPGVKTGNEGLAGLYVRGGNVDENLYLMDGIPLYNPSHMFGFFSTFNANAVKNVDFFRGSFPARYGGRLSSVVDVRLKEGNRERVHGNVSIGLIASKIDLEGPLEKGKSSFIFSARRTYMDLLISPFLRSLTEKEEGGLLTYYTGGYYFTDINAKVTRRFSEKDQLSFSLYWGKDHVKYTDVQKQTTGNPSIGGAHTPENEYKGLYHKEADWKWDWGNFISLLEYGTRLSPRLYGRFSVAYNNYASDIHIVESDTYATGYAKESYLRSSSMTSNKYHSGIRDLVVKAEVKGNWNFSHTYRLGGEYTYHSFTPEVSHMTHHREDEYDEEPVSERARMESRIYGHELAVFVEDEVEVTHAFRLHPGVRFTLFRVDRTSYLSVEPRLSFQYALNERVSLKASYAEMSQYVHLLAFGGMNMPSDLWVPVTRKLEPMRSRQVAVGGYYRFRKGWNMTLEGYYKELDNQVEYLDGGTILPEYRNWEENVATGKGDAYGVEWQLQKDIGKTMGWVNYTLSWANRWFPGKEINHGERFPAKSDSRHGVNVVVLHRFNERFDMSATWVYNSGARATIALEKYIGAQVEGMDYSHLSSLEIDHIEYRNNYQLPDYHRLDVGFNFHRQRKRGESVWNVSIYNLYSRLNPFFVHRDTRESDGEPFIRQASIFPIIPSFSYTFKF